MNNVKNSKQDKSAAYKTEEQLKREAFENIRVRDELEKRRKPKTEAEKKAENFWYHYKGITIAMVFVLLLAGIFIRDMLSPKPDMTIIMITTKYVSEEYLDELTKKIEAAAPELDGIEKTTISVDAICFAPGGFSDQAGTGQDDYATVMKIMAVIASGSDPVYILDKPNYEYMRSMSQDENGAIDEEYRIFRELDIPAALGDELPMSATVVGAGEIAPYFDELGFYIRDLNITDKNAEYYKKCMDFIESISR